jgi:D-alanyl-D-alanine dipeptidase
MWWGLPLLFFVRVLVDVSAVVPDAVIDLRYARADNFVREAVYRPGARCLLRFDVADRLARAAAVLRERDYRLVLWDCYRPHSVQRRFWTLVPDERYVAKPTETSGSVHSRAAAVDVSLADPSGRILPMPTAHDDFSERAHRGATIADPAIDERMRALDAAMTGAGFEGLPTEWWHYAAPGSSAYPLLDEPL